MSDTNGRFTPQNKTTQQRLSTHTVGLVALSDFRKRRAEVLEAQEREARDAAVSGANSAATSTPDRSQTGTPDPGSDDVSETRALKKKKKKPGKKLLSFDDDDGEEGDDTSSADAGSKFKANASIGIAPKAVTKAALRKEATEREALRREFVAVQEAVKATEIAIPFVFYDGANIPGGTVRMKKGDFTWVFLDKSRKVGAELGVGDQANARKAWARVGVDDLMLVRNTVIIPHHYDFYYFLINKSTGPDGLLFDYSADAKPGNAPTSALSTDRAVPDIDSLEGASDEPSVTKVVDRRWYEKNKHIYPASTWQEFDPEKDYAKEVRKDTGGNTYFFK